MDTFVWVMLGLLAWVLSVGSLNEGDEKLRRAEQRNVLLVVLMAFTWPLAAMVLWGSGVLRGWRRDGAPDSDPGQQFEAAGFFALSLTFFGLGIIFLSQRLSGGHVAALVFGPAFLGAAVWILRRWRRNWQRFAGGGHRGQVLTYLLGIPVCLAAGIAILSTIF